MVTQDVIEDLLKIRVREEREGNKKHFKALSAAIEMLRENSKDSKCKGGTQL